MLVELMGKANRNLSTCGKFLLTRLEAVPRSGVGGIRPSPLRWQGWTPSTEHFPLFNREVVGSFPGQRPVPQLEAHLIKHGARLAQSGGTGDITQAWGCLQVELSSGPPRMPSWPSQLNWEGGASASGPLTPEAC